MNTLCAPPTVWRMLIQEDLAALRGRLKLRELIGAGEPLNPEIIDQVREAWGLTLRDGFGQTETTAQVGNAPGQPVKAGSMGRPLPGYQVVLLDADDKESDEGEVCLKLDPRPLGLMACYEDSAEKTADVMRDGYYHTGDVAMRDAEGYLTFVGRADDVFKASDYRISPFELESTLIEHEAVTECAVVPSPDPVRLAVPKAFVTLAKDTPPSPELAKAILAFCRGAARALQARASHRVRERAAQDALRKDPAGGFAQARGREPREGNARRGRVLRGRLSGAQGRLAPSCVSEVFLRLSSTGSARPVTRAGTALGQAHRLRPAHVPSPPALAWPAGALRRFGRPAGRPPRPP